MSIRKIKYYRIWFAVISISILVLLIGVTATVLAYFNTGANRASLLNLPPIEPEKHVPKVEWLGDDKFSGSSMHDYNRAEITREYIKSWYARCINQITGDTRLLTDHFPAAQLKWMTAFIHHTEHPGYTIQEVDMEHHLQLHYFSPDGNLVSFTDHDVRLIQRIVNNQSTAPFFQEETTADFDVIMLLNRNKWQIKSMVRKPATIQETDTLEPASPNKIQIVGRAFMQDGVPYRIKGINYYPVASPWELFSNKYDSTIIQHDLQKISQLGFNTIRIFINFQEFNGGVVNPHRVTQLNNLLAIAEANRLKVIITLFDFLGNYHLLNYPACDRQLETLLTTFRNSSTILAWDLKNEPDLDFQTYGKETVMNWLAWMAGRARKYDPDHLLTVGWSDGRFATALADSLDFISFHAFTDTSTLSQYLTTIQQVQPTKPILIEEFGLSTYRGIWDPLGAGEKKQANFYRGMKAIFKRYDTGWMVWTLYDFPSIPPNTAGKWPWQLNPQKNFGILRSDGSPKPSVQVLSD
ncbi:cellulase (glycosyl hydrolase family 5) [Chitinophaga dinghuensis]|uniref:mannan endo-1,4-beta-mannosidase n=1 Tax=Chitinophaga dinghuensis TaxID=1539050 RepID=A0A327W043_9BACT|nr:cellulase family glycosylhydrolase [Chitinophaga dinghuensis]RAJ77412.1 cellulase (glycosyl hydrolase family 5) [Chitinophaga dinghuensis]